MKIAHSLELWTDGACEPNPGTGGYGFVIVNPKTGVTIERGGGPFLDTTNNQMEMLAVIRGLNLIHRRAGPRSVLVMSDSKYVVDGITSWIHGWKRKGWVTAGGKLVKNAGLWQKLDSARSNHELVAFQWVKGHAGTVYNEMADRLACDGRNSQQGAKRLNGVI